LKPMQYNNTYNIATTKEYDKEHKLKSMADLKKVERDAKAGFTLEFKDREDGYQGMQKKYNLDLNVKTMEHSIRQEAIAKNEVQMIDTYEKNRYMVELDLDSLDETKHLFPPYQGAHLMKQETIDKHPELEKILNKLANQITDEEMREMNYEVDYKDKPAHDV